MVITKESIKEIFEKLKEINNKKYEFIYSAKTNTFGYADIEEIYYKGQSILIGTKKEILKFQEYRLNMEIDLTEKEHKKSLSKIDNKEDVDYINQLRNRVNKIEQIPNDSLVGINDEGEVLENVNLFKVLNDIYIQAF